jgi:hypothetical protein
LAIGSLIKVLLFQSLVTGMRVTLHQLMATLTFSTKCVRRNMLRLDIRQAHPTGDHMLSETNLQMTKLRYTRNTCLLRRGNLSPFWCFIASICSLPCFYRVAAFSGAENDYRKCNLYSEKIRLVFWMVMRRVRLPHL